MRGIVTLAAAFAIPETLANGAPFGGAAFDTPIDEVPDDWAELSAGGGRSG